MHTKIFISYFYNLRLSDNLSLQTEKNALTVKIWWECRKNKDGYLKVFKQLCFYNHKALTAMRTFAQASICQRMILSVHFTIFARYNYKHDVIHNKFFVIFQRGSGIPELENRVKKPSYALWRHKTELSQILTP